LKSGVYETEILALPCNTCVSPQERQVVVSDNFTFPFVRSSIIKEVVIAPVSLCLLVFFSLWVGEASLFYQNMKRARQNSTCCLIAMLLIIRERHPFPETSHLVSVQTAYSVVISTCIVTCHLEMIYSMSYMWRIEAAG